MAKDKYRYTLKKFFKDWMLIIGIIAGASAYLIYHSIPAIHAAGPLLESVCKSIQPVFLFLMLLLSFCKIEPSQLRPTRWHLWLLLVQGGTFVLMSALLIWALGHTEGNSLSCDILKNRIPIEAAMLCLICPTATACAVVTGKLGGSMASVVTYTVLVNLMVAIVVPLVIPLLYPASEISFGSAFLKIISKVFPLLIMPCIIAWLIRLFLPSLHHWLLARVEFSFYIWAMALTLAILMSTRAVVQNENAVSTLVQIALVSFICCIFQFYVGKFIGGHYGYNISAGQALGQKNTVFGIWMGYTFMDPIISVAGGFYSIWHNCFNTWQLYKKRKRDEALSEPPRSEEGC